jgi:hypothetical protein
LSSETVGRSNKIAPFGVLAGSAPYKTMGIVKGRFFLHPPHFSAIVVIETFGPQGRCTMSERDLDLKECLDQGPQSALERKFIVEFLSSKGFTLHDWKALPKDEARLLMTQACIYASVKLAEIEAKAKLREDIHLPE